MERRATIGRTMLAFTMLLGLVVLFGTSPVGAQADTTPVGMCTVVVETEDKNFPCELVYDEASGTCEVVVHFSDESSITYLAGDACTEVLSGNCPYQVSEHDLMVGCGLPATVIPAPDGEGNVLSQLIALIIAIIYSILAPLGC